MIAVAAECAGHPAKKGGPASGPQADQAGGCAQGEFPWAVSQSCKDLEHCDGSYDFVSMAVKFSQEYHTQMSMTATKTFLLWFIQSCWKARKNSCMHVHYKIGLPTLTLCQAVDVHCRSNTRGPCP